jgi:uncharacterized protein (DUF2235 family)
MEVQSNKSSSIRLVLVVEHKVLLTVSLKVLKKELRQESTKLNWMCVGATGQGLEENVIKAYYFIATNYHNGDEIMLFGFSRGAYTARALGWYLTKMGVLRQIDLEDFRDIYREFKVGAHDIKFSDDSDLPALRGWKSRQHKKKDEKKESNAETKADSVDQDIAVTPEEGKVKPEPVTVKVIGVWDTVGALGLPESWLTTITGFNKAYQFYDTALNDSEYSSPVWTLSRSTMD